MKTLKLTSVFLILLTSTIQHAFSQGSAYLFPGVHKFSKATIYLDNTKNTVYKANRLIITNDVLNITPDGTETNQPQEEVNLKALPLQQVDMIRAYKGNEAVKYGIMGTLIGGAVGLLASAQGVSDAESQAALEGKVVTNSDKIIAGFTIGGAAVGLIAGIALGSSKDKWETIYSKFNKTSSAASSFDYALRLDLGANAVKLNVGLTK